MVLVFDTETNGKALDFKAPVNDTNNWPRIVQLAWAVYDDDGKQQGGQHLIQPDGGPIPEEVIAIHGITYDKAAAEGIAMSEALQNFLIHYEQVDTLIAHNIAFDYPVLLCEFIRYGMRSNNKNVRKVCTMQSSTNFCGIRGGFRGQFKWPKLVELHNKLFNQGFEGAHDAMNDVLACGRCFFELKRRGVIN